MVRWTGLFHIDWTRPLAGGVQGLNKVEVYMPVFP